jgi:hypothetical protein
MNPGTAPEILTEMIQPSEESEIVTDFLDARHVSEGAARGRARFLRIGRASHHLEA